MGDAQLGHVPIVKTKNSLKVAGALGEEIQHITPILFYFWKKKKWDFKSGASHQR